MKIPYFQLKKDIFRSFVNKKITMKINRLSKSLIVAFSIGILFSACSSNRLNVNTDNINIDFNIIRFDSLLFEPQSDSVTKNIHKTFAKYPEFSELYFQKVIKIGSPYSKDFQDLLDVFLTEYNIKMAYEQNVNIYGNFNPYKNKLQNAFLHYKYYFPEKNVPDIYLMMTGFNHSIVVADDILAIGLDNFLGSNSRFYDQLQISNYLRNRMEPSVLPFEAVKGWITTEFPYNDSIDNLVSAMVYHGKILYLMDALFPNEPDSLKIAYSARDMIWCEKSEDDMWLYMMDQKILFANDIMQMRRIVFDAPFTNPFGQDSPGRVGQWIGWQIVRSYMNKNAEVTIPELMANDDYQKILLQSGYNP
jgi:hypothetical protein